MNEICANCGEPAGTECACFRNKCLKCGGPVGNITFTYCDDCFGTKSAEIVSVPVSFIEDVRELVFGIGASSRPIDEIHRERARIVYAALDKLDGGKNA